MRSVAILLVCAACTDQAGLEFPIGPGGGPGTSVGSSGAGGDAGTMLRGRVCVINSLTTTLTCANTGADNLIVTLGDQQTTTNADGTFAINPVSGTGLSFQVSGPNVVTTSQQLTARQVINVLRQNAFDQMLDINQVVQPANAGSIIATVTQGGVGVSGVTAGSTPSPAAGPFFAGSEPMPWSSNATGASGIVWFPGINAGPADLSFFTGTGGSAIVGGVQVINGGITMVETPLP